MVASPSQLTRVELDEGEELFHVFLRCKGFLPFTPESVAAYKVEQIRKAAPKFYERPSFVLKCRDICLFVFVGCFILSPLSFGAGVWQLVTVPSATTPLVALTLLTIGAVGAYRLSCLFDDMTVKDDAVWRLRDYHDYRGFVPNQVKILACQIEGRFRSVDLFVDELVQGSYQLDPFLVVNYRGHSYYVAVWDETYAPPA